MYLSFWILNSSFLHKSLIWYICNEWFKLNSTELSSDFYLFVVFCKMFDSIQQ